MSRYDNLRIMREAKFAALDNLLRRIHGPATAFSAVAPSQQPALLTFRPLGRFRPSYGIDPHCPGVWRACHIPPGKLPVCFDDL